MAICPYCEREFGSQAALAGHIGRKHPDEAHVEVPKVGGRDLSVKPCPACGYKLPFTSTVRNYSLTVCPRCLCQYDMISAEVERPPPEFCVAELAGHPCPNGAHKLYWRKCKDEYAANTGQ